MVHIKGDGYLGPDHAKKIERASSGGGGGFITRLTKDMRVRFLTEPTEWFSYFEHFSDETKDFCCIGQENSCPGCESANEKVKRASRRYLANALDVTSNRVIALKVPVTLANRLEGRYERNNNTLTNRDYVLIPTGTGLSREYDVEALEPAPMDFTPYKLFDLRDIVAERFAEVFDLPDEQPSFKEETPAEKVDELAPFEPAPQGATEPPQGDGEYLTEEQLWAMEPVALLKLCRDCGLPEPTMTTKEYLVSYLLTNLGDDSAAD